MKPAWSVAMSTYSMSDELMSEIRGLIDEFAEAATSALSLLNIPVRESPVFRPFCLAVVKDSEKVLVGFGPSAGVPNYRWQDDPAATYDESAIKSLVEDDLGWSLTSSLVLPLPDDPDRFAKVQMAAVKHARQIETTSFARRAEATGNKTHLEHHLAAFGRDHPTFEDNVFLMMRFANNDQIDQIHAAIRVALEAKGMSALRADDKAYTDGLWSNIEVYLNGCKYGIAVFEDIHSREYNPNVSLELGYMLGQGKRTLLLKEQNLPTLHADVVHRLYKEFDIFNITESVTSRINQWVDVDLGRGRREV